MSKGEIVPDVMTTEENRSNTGAIASEGSRHLYIRADHFRRGRLTLCGKLDLVLSHVPFHKVRGLVRNPFHTSQSMFRMKPLSVERNVRQYSSVPVFGPVMSIVQRRIYHQPLSSHQANTYLSGLFSINVISFKCAKND